MEEQVAFTTPKAHFRSPIGGFSFKRALYIEFDVLRIFRHESALGRHVNE